MIRYGIKAPKLLNMTLYCRVRAVLGHASSACSYLELARDQMAEIGNLFQRNLTKTPVSCWKNQFISCPLAVRGVANIRKDDCASNENCRPLWKK